MKKILIFGLPRTGTTLLQKYLTTSLQIKSYIEPFNDQQYRAGIGDPYLWTASLDTCIIKVLSFDLDYVDLDRLINVGNFDSIIVTQRRNLTDLCASLCYAEQVAQQFHYYEKSDTSKIQNFRCSKEFIESWLRGYKWYSKAMTSLAKNSIDYSIFDYDKYINGQSQIIHGKEFCLATVDNYKIDSISVPIPYDKICLNYRDVEKIINENRD